MRKLAIFLSLSAAILLIAVILTPIAYESKKADLAPGCDSDTLMGGCAGKRIIKDISVGPEKSCLSVGANNCNGGVLIINNDCSQSVQMGRYTVAEGERETLEFKPERGEVRVYSSRGNYASYDPNTTRELSKNVRIGSENLSISYVKTQNLCRVNGFDKMYDLDLGLP
jgi:hypothetical protein